MEFGPHPQSRLYFRGPRCEENQKKEEKKKNGNFYAITVFCYFRFRFFFFCYLVYMEYVIKKHSFFVEIKRGFCCNAYMEV